MNEPYRYRVLQRYGLLKIVLACLALFFVQVQAHSVAGSYDNSDQQRVVRGTVTDENGDPFPYVTVIVEGLTTIGTLTDADGEYRLQVPVGSTLIFRFVGYRDSREAIGDRDVIDVQMEEDQQQLDEVVVIGYGAQRRAELTQSISTVTRDAVLEAPVTNISQSLQGRLPGLTSMQGSGQPGLDHATLYVRGVGTFGGASGNQPLYVIDGVERTQHMFRQLDPEEIESVSILKDAAATSVYGTRGANGVVLVTTRRGTAQAPEVSITANTSVQQFTRYPQLLDSYNALVLYNEALMNDGLDPAYPERELDMYRSGEDRYRYPNTDWYALMQRDWAPTSRLNVNLRGGSRTLTYNIFAGYFNQQSNFKTEQGRVYNPEFAFNRYNFRANFDANITSAFTIVVNLAGQISDRGRPFAQPSANMHRIGSWVMPAQNPDGSWAGTSEFPSSNPMWMLNTRGARRDLDNTVTSSIGINLDLSNFVRGLRGTARVAYDSSFGNIKQWTEVVQTHELISRPGRADRYATYLQRQYYSPGIASATPDRRVDFQAGLRYNRRFDLHNLGMSVFSNVSEMMIGSGIPYRNVNFIGSLNYQYDNRYLVEGRASYRGSENFAPGNRFGFFPSLSLGWNIHQEDFMAPVGFVNMLKPRVSVGLSGNDGAGVRFPYVEGRWTTGTGGGVPFGPTVGSALGSTSEPAIANPIATWETILSYNVGIDFTVWDNRIDVSLDRFSQQRRDILRQPNSFSGILGVGTPQLNIGETRTDGYEIELSYTHRVGTDLTFRISPNMSYFWNEVIFVDSPEDMDWWLKPEGHPINQPWGLVEVGYFRDWEEIEHWPVQQVGSSPRPGDFKYLDYNGDGVINQFDEVPISYTAVPNYTFGTSVSASYRGLTASLHFVGAMHSSIFLSQYLMWEFYNRASVQEHHLGRWTPETHETATYPRLQMGATSQNHVSNTFWRKDNRYIRLKTGSIRYRVPRNVTERLGIRGLSVNASGTNLLTWDRLKILDPETTTGTATSLFPQTRTFSLGGTINF